MTYELTDIQKNNLKIRLNKLNGRLRSLSTDEEWIENRKQIGEVLYQLGWVEDPTDMDEVERVNMEYIIKQTKEIIQHNHKRG